MKEVYMSPAAKVVCFAPVERLAGVMEDYEQLLGPGPVAQGTSGNDATVDIDVSIPSNPDGTP